MYKFADKVSQRIEKTGGSVLVQKDAVVILMDGKV